MSLHQEASSEAPRAGTPTIAKTKLDDSSRKLKQQQKSPEEVHDLVQSIFNVDEKFTCALRVRNQDVEQLFSEIDTDHNEDLSSSELKAFLQGRYDMTLANCNSVFSKYDKDNSSSISLVEFSVIVDDVNGVLNEFDKDEMKYQRGLGKKLTWISCYEVCCCLPTLCTSWCCGGYWSANLLKEHIQHEDSRPTRINEAISKGLLMERA
jgi:hypothetical protein